MKNEKHAYRNKLRRGLIFTFSLPGRRFVPLSITSLSLGLVAAQYNDFTCLWVSSSSFSEAFSNTPKYFAWWKNRICTPFRKTFGGAGFLYFPAKKVHQMFYCNYKRFRIQQHCHHKYSEDTTLGCIVQKGTVLNQNANMRPAPGSTHNSRGRSSCLSIS